MQFFASKTAVALCVEDLLKNSKIDWQLITITKLEKSEALSVHIVTDTSLEGIAEKLDQTYFEALLNISRKNISGG